MGSCQRPKKYPVEFREYVLRIVAEARKKDPGLSLKSINRFWIHLYV